MGQCTIAICTRDRPNQLSALLQSLHAAVGECEAALDVLVVDNSSDEATWKSLQLWAPPSGWTLAVVREGRPGLVRARNAALQAAKLDQPLVFLDDDERVRSDWVAQLLSALTEFPGDLVAGAVEVSGPDGQRRGRKLPPRGASLPNSGTGNLILPPSLLSARYRFDSRFDASGGEDTAFTVAAVEAGWIIRSAPEMGVVEDWDASRWTAEARRQRARQSAAVYSMIHRRSATRALRRCASAAVVGSRGCVILLKGRATGDADSVARGAESLGAALGTLEGLVGRLPSR